MALYVFLLHRSIQNALDFISGISSGQNIYQNISGIALIYPNNLTQIVIILAVTVKFDIDQCRYK